LITDSRFQRSSTKYENY